MADLRRTVGTKYVADTKEAQASVKRYGDELAGAGDKSTKAGEKVGGLDKRNRNLGESLRNSAIAGTSMGLVMDALASPLTLVTAGIGSLVAGGVKAVNAFAELETAVAEVTTLFDATPESVDNLYAALQRVSVSFGLDSVEGARAYYQIVSAGATAGAEANAILEQAAKAAIGGVTDVATSADTLTSVLNAYGLAGEDVTRVSDVLFNTVRAGKTTFGELGASVGQIAPIAANAGVSMEELFAAIAEVTKVGLPTAQSVTAVRAAIQAIIKPARISAKLANELGIEFNAEALAAKGLSGVLADVQRATNGNVSQMARLFGSVEALPAVFALSAGEGAAFRGTIEGMGNAAGATAGAVESMSDTIGFQMDRLEATSTAALQGVGRGLAEAFNVTDLIDGAANSLARFGVALGSLDATVLPINEQIEVLNGKFDALIRNTYRASDGVLRLNNYGKEYISDANDLISAIAQQDGGLELLRGRLAEVEAEIAATVATEGKWHDSKQRLRSALRREAVTLRQGIKAQEEATQAAAEAAEQEAATAKALEEATRIAREETEALKELEAASKGVASENSRLEKSVQRLIEQFNPLVKVEREYEEKVQDVQSAMAFGIITFQEATDIVKNLTDARDEEIRKTNESASATKAHEKTVANAGAELRKYESQVAGLADALVDVEGELAANADAQTALRQAYADGTISLAEYESQIAVLQDAQTILTRAQQDGHETLTEQERAALTASNAIQALSGALAQGAITQAQYDRGLQAINESLDETKTAAEETAEAFDAMVAGHTLTAIDAIATQFGDLGNIIRDVFNEDVIDGFFDSLNDGGGFLESLSSAFGGTGGFAQGLGNAIGSYFASESTGGAIGAAAGSAIGSSIGGPVGAGIGAAIGGGIGDFLQGLFGSDLEKLVSVGVGVGLSDLRSSGARGTGASGLRLQAFSLNAGDQGERLSEELLRAFLEIDRTLTEFFEDVAGIEIDFSRVEIERRRTGLRGLRDDPNKEIFGSVSRGEFDESQFQSAADEFVRAWLDALRGHFPDLGAEFSDFLGSQTLDEFLTRVQTYNDAVAAAEEERIQNLIASEEERLRLEQNFYAERIAQLETQRIGLEAELTGIDLALTAIDEQRNQYIEAARGIFDLTTQSFLTDDVRRAVGLLGDSVVDRFRRATNELANLDAANFVGGFEALRDALVETRNAALEAAAAYAQIANTVTASLGDAATRIRERFLSSEDLAERRLRDFIEVAAGLNNLNAADLPSPETINANIDALNRLAGDLTTLISSIFGELGSTDVSTNSQAYQEATAFIERILGLVTDANQQADLRTGLDNLTPQNFDRTFSEIIARILTTVAGNVEDVSNQAAQNVLAEAEGAQDSVDQTVESRLTEALTEFADRETVILDRREMVVTQLEQNAANMAEVAANYERVTNDLENAAATIREAAELERINAETNQATADANANTVTQDANARAGDAASRLATANANSAAAATLVEAARIILAASGEFSNITELISDESDTEPSGAAGAASNNNPVNAINA